MCSTLFLYTSLLLFCMTTTWNFQKLLSYTEWRKCHTCSCSLFFAAPHVHLAFDCWPTAFLILLPLLQNFHVVLPPPKFFIRHPRSLSPFFSLSFAGLPPNFSCSIFQICRHDNQSKLNTLDNTDTETISALCFHLYWLFSCLCFTRHRWLCDFPPK